MLANLQVLFDRNERQRRQLLQQVEGMNAAQLAFAPGSRTWSLLEEVHHLVLTEQEIVRQATQPDVIANLLCPQERPIPFAVVWLILRCGIRVPVPVTSVLPTPDQSLPTLTVQWKEARSQLQHLLEALNAPQVRQPFAVHPVCGALMPTQVLEFLLAHGHYHRRHMQRLRRSRRFPR